jgi:acetyltransferase-like isoleucine patch superfamily enzyme
VGRDVHTGIYLHWVQGSGVITVGDRTTVDGKCSFAFSSAHRPDPTLAIGSNVWIGHGCGFTVADRIDIGDHVMIAGECSFLDSSGHPTDPDLRRAKQPAPRDRVRPIVIERDAWIGQRSILLPGTTVGEGAVVAAHSVVRGRVEPFTIVAGNPAQVVGRVKRTDS